MPDFNFLPSPSQIMKDNDPSTNAFSSESNLGAYTDNSSGAMQYHDTPYGDTWRGVGSSWFNKQGVVNEDWIRGEQSAENTTLRQNWLDEQAFERSKWMTEHQYELATKGMQSAGLNPILAYQSASAASSSAGSAGSASSSGGSDSSDPLSGILSTAVALITTLVAGKYRVAAAAAGAANQVFNSYTANYQRGNRYYKK